MAAHGISMVTIYMGSSDLPTAKVHYVPDDSEDLEDTAAAHEEDLHRDGDDGSVC